MKCILSFTHSSSFLKVLKNGQSISKITNASECLAYRYLLKSIGMELNSTMQKLSCSEHKQHVGR